MLSSTPPWLIDVYIHQARDVIHVEYIYRLCVKWSFRQQPDSCLPLHIAVGLARSCGEARRSSEIGWPYGENSSLMGYMKCNVSSIDNISGQMRTNGESRVYVSLYRAWKGFRGTLEHQYERQPHDTTSPRELIS